MNKKIILIISAAVLIIALAIYFLTKPSNPTDEIIPISQQSEQQKELSKTTEDATTKILSFSDNTTQEYQDSIKPYLSDEMIESTKELAITQKEFNDQQGFTSTQQYKVKKIELVDEDSEDGEILTYKVTGSRIYKDSEEPDTTYIKYQKIDGQWKIIDIEPEF